MSNFCVTLVQRRRVGSSTKKSVLVYLADRASDDGSGIWTSKAHIAADTELSKRSVQNAMADLEREGLIKKIGKRKCQNGFTFEYQMDLEAVEALPNTRSRGAGDSPLKKQGVQEIHLTGAGDSPQDVQEIHPNHPRTILEPSNKKIKKEKDLFSEHETEPETEPPKPDPIEEGFKRFWEEWPVHKRKAGKADCAKVFRSACEGRHQKFDGTVTPDALCTAAQAYVGSLRGDMTFLKGPLPWLRQPGFEPFLGQEARLDPDTLTKSQFNALSEGRVPPSMREGLKPDGKPTTEAEKWLKYFGRPPIAAE